MESEFGDEAILKSTEEPFNPSLGLRRPGLNGTNLQLIEETTKLGGCGPSLQLFLDGELLGVLLEDAVTVAVESHGPAVALNDLTQEQEVALRVFLGTEHSTDDLAGGIIHANQ